MASREKYSATAFSVPPVYPRRAPQERPEGDRGIQWSLAPGSEPIAAPEGGLGETKLLLSLKRERECPVMDVCDFLGVLGAADLLCS